MTKPKKFLYKVLYKDDTYMLVDWTKEDFKKVCAAKVQGSEAVFTDETLLDLTMVRAVLYIPPIPEPTENEKKDYNKKMAEKTKKMMEEWGFVDQETMNWLEENGILSMDDLEGVE